MRTPPVTLDDARRAPLNGTTQAVVDVQGLRDGLTYEARAQLGPVRIRPGGQSSVATLTDGDIVIAPGDAPLRFQHRGGIILAQAQSSTDAVLVLFPVVD